MHPEIFNAILRNDIPAFLCLVGDSKSRLKERSPKHHEDTVLHLASRLGHTLLVSEIIKLCPSLVGSRNSDGETPLHVAARFGNANIAMQILESGEAACVARNHQNQTALFLACRNLHLYIARLILQQQESFGVEELNAAISSGYTDVAGTILQRCPDLAWQVDGSQSVPLHHACDRRNLEITRMLLGLDPRFAERIDIKGLSPLHLVAIKGSVEILMEFLDKAPLSFHCLTSEKETVLHLAARYKNTDAFIFMAQNFNSSKLLHQSDKEGNTVLHIAASTACTPLIHYIADKTTVDITTKNKRGFEALNLLDQDIEDFDLLSTWLRIKAGNCQIDAAETPTEATQNEQETVLSSQTHTEDSGHSTPIVESVSGAYNPPEQDAEFYERLSEITPDLSIKSPADTPEEGPEIIPETTHQIVEKMLTKKLLEIFAENTYQTRRMIKKHQKQILQLSRIRHNRKYEMHKEALQNARNTLTIIAVLIATVTFTGGINPPGGVYQDGPLRGKSTVGRTAAFKVFAISNNVALFTSLCIVILLVSIIPYKTKPLMKLLVATHKMMWVATGFMATAYTAATWVTVPHNGGTKWFLPTIMAISSGTLGALFVYLAVKLIRHMLRKIKWKDDRGLRSRNSESMSRSSIKKRSNASSISDVETSEVDGYYTY